MIVATWATLAPRNMPSRSSLFHRRNLAEFLAKSIVRKINQLPAGARLQLDQKDALLAEEATICKMSLIEQQNTSVAEHAYNQ